jgi:hypothetical protein
MSIFELYYGLGFYGGNGPLMNQTSENVGYGQDGVSWLTHKSFNQTNVFDNNLASHSYSSINTMY